MKNIFVLSYTDEINISSSESHVSNNTEIVGVGEKKDLIRLADTNTSKEGNRVYWRGFDDEKNENLIGYIVYGEDDIEYEQFYVITKSEYVSF